MIVRIVYSIILSSPSSKQRYESLAVVEGKVMENWFMLYDLPCSGLYHGVLWICPRPLVDVTVIMLMYYHVRENRVISYLYYDIQ